MSPRPVRIVMHDLHFDIVVNGRVLAHSEQYASKSNAERAARSLIHAINHHPMHLELWKGPRGHMRRVVERVRRVWMWGSRAPISLPVRFEPPPNFDSHLESMGT